MVKRRLHPEVGGLGAQDPHAHRVERRHPHRSRARRPDQVGDPLLHLAGGLVREGDREDLPRLRAAGGQQVGDPPGQHPGLAGAGAGDHQQRRTAVLDGRPLRAVEALEQFLGALAGRVAPRRRVARTGSDRVRTRRGCAVRRGGERRHVEQAGHLAANATRHGGQPWPATGGRSGGQPRLRPDAGGRARWLLERRRSRSAAAPDARRTGAFARWSGTAEPAGVLARMIIVWGPGATCGPHPGP